MFLIRTRVGPSAIHGTGVFADEPVAPGQSVWRYDPVFDRTFSQEDYEAAAPAVRAYLNMYAYRALELGHAWVLPGDHARFLNHSDHPNTTEHHFESRGRTTIAFGEEITCDYGTFCADWDRDEFTKINADVALPHCELYTRIEITTFGVGVVAIRDIPEGTCLFVGDVGETVRVPVTRVEAIADAAIRKMYYDFCPEEGGFLVAPANFNQLTMGWYLNHSDSPNVFVDLHMRFRTARQIRRGEELTSNYRSYSDSAKRLIDTWRS
jgi:hypothetical protein